MLYNNWTSVVMQGYNNWTSIRPHYLNGTCPELQGPADTDATMCCAELNRSTQCYNDGREGVAQKWVKILSFAVKFFWTMWVAVRPLEEREKGERIVKMLKHPNGDEYSAKVKQISSYVLPCAWICWRLALTSKVWGVVIAIFISYYNFFAEHKWHSHSW